MRDFPTVDELAHEQRKAHRHLAPPGRELFNLSPDVIVQMRESCLNQAVALHNVPGGSRSLEMILATAARLLRFVMQGSTDKGDDKP